VELRALAAIVGCLAAFAGVLGSFGPVSFAVNWVRKLGMEQLEPALLLGWVGELPIAEAHVGPLAVIRHHSILRLPLTGQVGLVLVYSVEFEHRH